MDDALLDRLTQHRTLGTAPREELTWLVTHGILRSFHAGDVTTRQAQPEEWLLIVLSGRLAIHLDRGAGSRRIIEWRAGDVCGLMPYSRGGAPPGDTVVEEATELLAVHRDQLPAMIRECPGVTARLVHAMLDRARHFTSSDLHDEKLVSLGKLAAGLAHEINNPASAAARGARRLVTGVADSDAAARSLAAQGLTQDQLTAIDRVSEMCLTDSADGERSALDRADREDAIGAWLETRRVDASAAALLAETAVTVDALDRLAREIDGDALDAAVRWIAAGCLTRTLARQIDISTTRIHALVAAVTRFTYLDQAPAPEAVDIRPGLMDTLAILAGKTREKRVDVRVDLPPDLPRVLASGAELNQVWANLIDNALDAVAPTGRVEISAASERGRLVVEITDNGSGIPPEIRDRIFDPFFTTKPVGQGTGLGLDIVRRLVRRQQGEVEVESRPGRTVFRVSLPAYPSRG